MYYFVLNMVFIMTQLHILSSLITWFIRNVLNGFAGSLILEYYGWRSVFYSLGILSLFWVLIVQTMFKQNERTTTNSEMKQEKSSFYDIPWCLYMKSKGFW